MKKYFKLSIFLVIVLIAWFGFIIFNRNSQITKISNSQTVQTKNTKLRIDDGDNSQIFDISNFSGKTALEATETSTKTKTSGKSVNAFITSINGHTANPKNEFWELIINGKSSEVGAGSYIIKTGDQIEWKITTFKTN